MASEISICNQALVYLGQKPITNLLEPKTTVEQFCAQTYPPVRDACLQEAAWTFAQFEVELESTLAADWGGYRYPYDADWLVVLRAYRSINVNGITQGRVQADWRKVGDWLISPSDKLYVTGTYREKDPSKWSPAFQLLVATRLAAEMAVGITENRSLAADLWSLFDVKLSQAMISDGIQGRNEIMEARKLVDARSGNGGYR